MRCNHQFPESYLSTLRVLCALVALAGTLFWHHDARAQVPYRVRDIDQRTADSHDDSWVAGVHCRSLLFFTANDGTFDQVKLWKSDGTAAGTRLVKDIYTHDDYVSMPYVSEPGELTCVNDVLFFAALDASHGYELWKSDGTKEGTVLVKDIREGRDSSRLTSLVNVNGTLFFAASDEEHEYKLWKSDGSETGTVPVTALSTGTFIANVNESVFFIVGIPGGGELWKTDGTGAGTTRVSALAPVPWVGSAVAGDTLFFMQANGELWKSDGTEAGTVLVKSLVHGFDWYDQIGMKSLGGALLFGADNSLWRSDGTESGTIVLFPHAAGHLTIVGDDLFFVGDGALWKTDGTVMGTMRVVEIPEPAGGLELSNVNGALFFSVHVQPYVEEIWKSDGTKEGTIPIRRFHRGDYKNSYYSVSLVAPIGDILFFYAHDERYGYELWRTDGTASATGLVRDINARPRYGTGPESLTVMNGSLFFSATDEHGSEVWRSDGTENGTQMVKDIAPGNAGSYPRTLMNADGTLFFIGNDSQLWRSDGSTEGTSLVSDVFSNSWLLKSMGGTVFFGARDDEHGYELWNSDGTEAGTVLVKDIAPGPGSSGPAELTDVDGTLFFSARDGTNGRELWKSDGTAAGTVLVRDLVVGSGSSNPSYLTNADGVLTFAVPIAYDRLPQLWRSDGTPDGTAVVKELSRGVNSLTNVDGSVFFTADDGVHGNELWKSDGTSGTTGLIRDIRVGSQSSDPHDLIDVDGTLFFLANNGMTGVELWKSDGTEAGTVLVKDVLVGTESGFRCTAQYDHRWASGDGMLLFAADHGDGCKLWKSDGTTDGTIAIAEVLPDLWDGYVEAYARGLTYVDGTAFFVAHDDIHGSELWAVSVAGCGNGIVTGSEECDDGDRLYAYGQNCDVQCRAMPCGLPTTGRGGVKPKAADALWALRTAVGQVSCDLSVCDVDGSGQVHASDALRILKAAVGLDVALTCAPQ